MEMIRLRYRAGKSVGKLYHNRKRYVFNKENNFIAEVPIRMFWDKNFFEPAPVETKAEAAAPSTVKPETVTASTAADETLCAVCGFKAKTRSGCLAHKRIKHKEA